MKKINILKAIADYICIMSYLAIPLLVLFLGYLFITDEPIFLDVHINGNKLTILDITSKIMMVFLIVSLVLMLYSVFLFRNILSLFQKNKIFDFNVINNFKNIGILLIIASLLSGIPLFIYQLIHKKINFEIGINTYIILFILGLFSMILSEVFAIAKKQKEENELTI